MGFVTSFAEEKAFFIDAPLAPVKEINTESGQTTGISLPPVDLASVESNLAVMRRKRQRTRSLGMRRVERTVGAPEQQRAAVSVDSGRIQSPPLPVIQKQAWHRCGSLPSAFPEFS